MNDSLPIQSDLAVSNVSSSGGDPKTVDNTPGILYFESLAVSLLVAVMMISKRKMSDK